MYSKHHQQRQQKKGKKHQPVMIPLEPVDQQKEEETPKENKCMTNAEIADMVDKLLTELVPQYWIPRQSPESPPQSPVKDGASDREHQPVLIPLVPVGQPQQPVMLPLKPVGQVQPAAKKQKSKPRKCKFFGTAKGCLNVSCRFRHVQETQQSQQPQQPQQPFFFNATTSYQPYQPQSAGYKMSARRNNNNFRQQPY